MTRGCCAKKPSLWYAAKLGCCRRRRRREARGTAGKMAAATYYENLITRVDEAVGQASPSSNPLSTSNYIADSSTTRPSSPPSQPPRATTVLRGESPSSSAAPSPYSHFSRSAREQNATFHDESFAATCLLRAEEHLREACVTASYYFEAARERVMNWVHGDAAPINNQHGRRGVYNGGGMSEAPFASLDGRGRGLAARYDDEAPVDL